MEKSRCLVCDRPVRTRGYCRPHYRRLLKHGDPLAGRTPPGEPQAFIDRLLAAERQVNCVTWPFSTTDGYAHIKLDGKQVSVSRLICRMVYGEPPHDDMHAAHRCGNGARGCVNPSCLYWATKTENESDKILHGTVMIGEKNGQSKLTDEQAEAIRNDTRLGRVIAAEYGICKTHVSRIRSGKRRAGEVKR